MNLKENLSKFSQEMLVLSLHDLHLYKYFRITHTVNHLRSNKKNKYFSSF